MNPLRTETVRDRIDEEHAALLVQLENFAQQLFDPACVTQVEDSLRELLIGIGMHFGFEESLMVEGHYAEFEHHRRQHIGIMTELGLLLDRVETANDPAGTARSADLLAEWYREHVAHSDRALLDWLVSRP
jgi:hemerythrin-like metal-binding protein